MPSFIDDLILKAALEPSLGVKNRKPIGPIEVDWTNPLTRGLELIWLFNEMGGIKVLDAAKGRNGTLSTDGTALPLWKVQPFLKSTTPCISDFGAVTAKNYVESTWKGILGTGPRSVVIGYRQNGTTVSSANSTLFSYGSTTPADGGERFALRLNDDSGAGNVGALRFEVNGGYYTGSTDLELSNGVVGISVPNAANVEDVSLFVNGKIESSTGSSAGQAVNTTSGSNVTLGKNPLDSPSPDRYWSGRFFFLIMYSRELHPSEQRQLAEDPYQILKPQGQFSVFMPAAAGTTVAATTDSLVITENAATVNAATNIQSTADSLSITTQTASVSLDKTVAAAVDGLSITANTADVNLDKSVTAATDGLVITEYAATVTLEAGGDVNVAAASQALIVTENTAAVSLDKNISASAASLSITEQGAGISLGKSVQAGAGSLVFTENTAGVSLDKLVSAGVSALALTEHNATVTAGVAISANTAAITLTEQAASINAARNVLVNTAPLLLTEYAATIQAPGQKEISIDGQGSYVINSNNGSVTLYFNKQNYFTI